MLIDLEDWRADLEDLDFTKSDEMEAMSLELPFTEEEVKVALCELNGGKALGSYGFTVAFWQFNWNTVKSEVMAVFKDFFDMGKSL